MASVLVQRGNLNTETYEYEETKAENSRIHYPSRPPQRQACPHLVSQLPEQWENGLWLSGPPMWVSTYSSHRKLVCWVTWSLLPGWPLGSSTSSNTAMYSNVTVSPAGTLAKHVSCCPTEAGTRGPRAQEGGSAGPHSGSHCVTALSLDKLSCTPGKQTAWTQGPATNLSVEDGRQLPLPLAQGQAAPQLIRLPLQPLALPAHGPQLPLRLVLQRGQAILHL
jgi:hypothetical protein